MLPMSIVLVFGDIPCEAAENSRTFSFYFENDLFADTDKGYTNGIKLSWISPGLTGYAESGRLQPCSLPLSAGCLSSISRGLGAMLSSPSGRTFIHLKILRLKI